MKKTIDILKWLMPLAGLLATACGYDHIVEDGPREDESTSYVELRIAMPADNGSRGEEGNGREYGLEKEDKVHDINIFFYQEEDALGLNSPDNIPIFRHIFYNFDDPNDKDNSDLAGVASKDDVNRDENKPFIEKNYLVIRFYGTNDEIKMAENNGLDFVAIANVGKLQDFFTLGALRNFDLSNEKSSDKTNSWSKAYDEYSKDASNMDYFLMSTAYSEEYSFNGMRTGKNKVVKVGDSYSGTTTLQRMYARIDLWYSEAQNALKSVVAGAEKVSGLKYAVDGADGNIVYLTNVLPVNVMKTPSYLFKKVTDEPKNVWDYESFGNLTKFKWGGLETSVGDMPSNYVMAAHTLEKLPEGQSSDVLDTWYGNSACRRVKDSIKDDLNNATADVDNGKFTRYYHGVQKRVSGDPDYDCDHISVIGYANENTQPTDCYTSDYLTGLAFRGVYVPGRIIAGYSGGNMTDMTTDQKAAFAAEGKNIYRYSPTDKDVKEAVSLYFTDLDLLESYRKDHPEDDALVTTFGATRAPGGALGFICYYNLWLRHNILDAADPHVAYPMEYATVRNNIYRVKVAFTGPGDPEPTMREPDTMQARIFVRKWNFRQEDTFVFDKE